MTNDECVADESSDVAAAAAMRLTTDPCVTVSAVSPCLRDPRYRRQSRPSPTTQPGPKPTAARHGVQVFAEAIDAASSAK